MAKGDGVTAVSGAATRLFLVANLLFGLAFAIAILASFPFAGAITGRLSAKYGSAVDASAVLVAIRLLLVGGIVGVAVLHRVFANLLAILRTIRSGDPFTIANASRLQAIGWALLAFQFLDLVLGGFTAWFAHLHVQFATWSPALGGWLAVLLAFVLAGVFRHGATVRDDLAATI